MPTLDRFLVLLEHKGIHPIVYISKLDLLEDMEDIHYHYQGIYQAIGYDFVLSIEELLPFGLIKPRSLWDRPVRKIDLAQ